MIFLLNTLYLQDENRKSENGYRLNRTTEGYPPESSVAKNGGK
jgi:hypothetical protein